MGIGERHGLSTEGGHPTAALAQLIASDQRSRSPGITEPTRKWGEALDAGFQVLPDTILRHAGALDLSPTAVLVLLHLTMAWWNAEQPPFLRVSTMARRMNVSARTVQRSLASLRKQGILTWRDRKIGDEMRRHYDLSLLVEKAKTWAARDLELRQRPAVLLEETGRVGVHTRPPRA